MKKIKYKEKVVAIVHKIDEWKENLDFITDNDDFIQCGTWWYDKGKSLKAHRHIYNERNVTQTQEAIVVMSGKLRVDLYDENDSVFCAEIIRAGDLFVILDIGHGYEILDDKTKIIEIKNGPFISVEKDKKLIL